MTALRQTPGIVAALLFVLFVVALNPPVVTAVSSPSLVLGVAPLYLWFVGWGAFGSLVLVWAAHRDAFGLAEDQVPPDLGGPDEATRGPDADTDDPGAD